MILVPIKKRIAEATCGCIVLFGMVYGSMVLIGEMAAFLTEMEAHLAWVPSMYVLLTFFAIFCAYNYLMLKLLVAVATWADI